MVFRLAIEILAFECVNFENFMENQDFRNYFDCNFMDNFVNIMDGHFGFLFIGQSNFFRIEAR